MFNLTCLAWFNSIPEILGQKKIILDDKATVLKFKFYNLLGLDLENSVTLKSDEKTD
jgi:hypothetical protein